MGGSPYLRGARVLAATLTATAVYGWEATVEALNTLLNERAGPDNAWAFLAGAFLATLVLAVLASHAVPLAIARLRKPGG